MLEPGLEQSAIHEAEKPIFPDPKEYIEKYTAYETQQNAIERKKKLFERYEATDGLLPDSLKIVTVLKDIRDRLAKVNASIAPQEIFLTRSDEVNASTDPELQFITVHQGMIGELVRYAKEHNIELTADQLATLEAHEGRHDESPEQKLHGAETYADVSAFYDVLNAGFEAHEAVVFEQAMTAYDRKLSKTGTTTSASPTHPRSTFRETAYHKLLGSEDTYLPLAVEATPVDTETLDELDLAVQEKNARIEKRQLVATPEQFQEAIKEAKTVGEMIEIFRYFDKNQQALRAIQFSGSDEFMTLLFHISNTAKVPFNFQTLTNQAYINSLIAHSQDLRSASESAKQRADASANYSNAKEFLSLTQNEKISQYKFKPASAQSFIDSHGQMIDTFISERKDDPPYLRAKWKEVLGISDIELPNEDKGELRMKGIEKSLRDKVDVAGSQMLPHFFESIACSFINNNSMLIGVAQSDMFDIQQSCARIVSKMGLPKTDYSMAYHTIKARLRELELCTTDEVSHDATLLILTNGVEKSNVDKSNNVHFDDEYASFTEDSSLRAVDSKDPAIQQDLIHFLSDLRLGFCKGGIAEIQELTLLFDEQRQFKESMKSYIEKIVENRRKLSEIKPFFESVRVAYFDEWNTHGVAEHSILSSDTFSNQFKTFADHDEALDYFDSYRKKFNHKFAQIEKSNMIDDQEFLKKLLFRGVENHSLSVDAIFKIGNKITDQKIRDSLIPYIGYVINRGDVTDFLKQEFKTKQKSDKSKSIPEIAYEMAVKGAVVDISVAEISVMHDSLSNKYNPNNSQGNPAPSELIDKFFPVEECKKYFALLKPMIDSAEGTQKELLIKLCTQLGIRGMGMRPPEAVRYYGLWGKEAAKVDLEFQAENINYLEDLGNFADLKSALTAIKEIPEGKIRDYYCSYLIQYIVTNNAVNEEFSVEDVAMVMNLASPDLRNKLDIDHYHSKVTLNPLHAGASDIAEFFIFPKGSTVDSPLQLVPVLEKHLLKSFEEKKLQMNEQIDMIGGLIEHKGALRDYLIERVFDRHNVYSNPDTAEKAALLKKAFPYLETTQSKTKVGRLIVEYSVMQGNLSFDAGLKEIIAFMPSASVDRDEQINKLINRNDTTWQQLSEVKQYFIGNNVSTLEKDSLARNIRDETMHELIQDTKSSERAELLLYYLSKNRHIHGSDEITPSYIDDMIWEKLKAQMSWYYGESLSPMDNLSTPEEDKDQIITEILAHANAHTPADIPPTKLNQTFVNLCLKDFNRKKLLDLGFPESVIEKLNKNISPDCTYNSLGDSFFSQNNADRRSMIYDICLGDEGIFEDTHFEDSGRKFISEFIDLTFAQYQPDALQGFNKDLITDAVTIALRALPSYKRTESLSQLVNRFTTSGGSSSPAELLKMGLSSFEIVGVKIGQMDAFLPKNVREELNELKEPIPNQSKIGIADQITKAGIDRLSEGLKPLVNGGSTAAVVKEISRDTNAHVIKVIKPSAEYNLPIFLNAAKLTIREIAAKYGVDFDPSKVIANLQAEIAKELDPKLEEENIKHFADLGRKGIHVPQVSYVSDKILRMSEMPGESLNALFRENKLSDEEASQISRTIISSYFEMAIEYGVLDTDLHSGNVFKSNERLSIIDFGQVFFETNSANCALYKQLTESLLLNNTEGLVAVISQIDPSADQDEIQQIVESSESVNIRITKLRNRYDFPVTMDAFLKGLLTVLPYMSKLQFSDFMGVFEDLQNCQIMRAPRE